MEAGLGGNLMRVDCSLGMRAIRRGGAVTRALPAQEDYLLPDEGNESGPNRDHAHPRVRDGAEKLWVSRCFPNFEQGQVTRPAPANMPEIGSRLFTHWNIVSIIAIVWHCASRRTLSRVTG
jgi:hypothetical protein